MKDMVLIGGGGHCRSAIEVIESSGVFKIRGVLERDGKGAAVSGYEIIGDDSAIGKLVSEGNAFHITIGHVGDPAVRIRLFESLIKAGAQLPVIISKHAIVSSRGHIGDGTIIMHRAVVNAGAKIGVNCIINTGALVEHDAVIGEHVHIATSAVVNGDCRIGARSFVGSGAIILQGVTVAEGTIIGAGAVVHRDITEKGTTVAGVPARRIR